MEKEKFIRALIDDVIREAKYEALRELEKAIETRAFMLDNLLYQDTSFQIYMSAIGEKSDAISSKRNDVRILSKAYWKAAHEVNNRIKALKK